MTADAFTLRLTIREYLVFRVAIATVMLLGYEDAKPLLRWFDVLLPRPIACVRRALGVLVAALTPVALTLGAVAALGVLAVLVLVAHCVRTL